MNERRIATVLRVRELRERIARSEVAIRRVVLEQRRASEAAARAAVRERAVADPRIVQRFVAHRHMLHAGVADAATARERVAVADQDVEVAMTSWRDEARRLDGIERLADRVMAEVRAERERVERNEVDDIVVMRHGASGEGGGAR